MIILTHHLKSAVTTHSLTTHPMTIPSSTYTLLYYFAQTNNLTFPTISSKHNVCNEMKLTGKM